MPSQPSAKSSQGCMKRNVRKNPSKADFSDSSHHLKHKKPILTKNSYIEISRNKWGQSDLLACVSAISLPLAKPCERFGGCPNQKQDKHESDCVFLRSHSRGMLRKSHSITMWRTSDRSSLGSYLEQHSCKVSFLALVIQTTTQTQTSSARIEPKH